MADLFTHYVSARLPGAFLRDRRLQAFLVLGTFLPDLVAKGLYWVAQAPADFDDPSHSILGLALLSYLGALFVEERLRSKAFAFLYAGSLLHVVVDLVKDNQGRGSARLLYPFTTTGTEFAWIASENVVLLLPIDAVILLIAWLLERRLVRVQQ